MAHTVKTKPGKISAKLGTCESLVGHGQVDDNVLDLFRGFSTHIYLGIRSEDEENVKFYFPACVKVKVRSNSRHERVEIDLGRAMQMGLLEIADDNDRAVSLKPVDRELENLCANLRKAECGLCEAYPVTTNARLLTYLRRCLLPGKQYELRFCGQHFTFWSKFCNTGSTDEVSLRPYAKVQMTCTPEPLLFTVKAGIRIPRFTVSFSISSSTLYLDEPHRFFVTLTVTSLEDQPVTVAPLFDRIATEKYPGEYVAQSSLGVFKIFDEEAGDWGTLESNPEKSKQASIKGVAMPLLQFNKGTSYTRNVHFPRHQLSSHECRCAWECDSAGIIPGRTFKMASRAGYVAWDYGYVHELQGTHSNREDWTKHGPIVFESVSAVALTIKAIFEREKPKPFFTLPLELRDQVYEYLRWSEHADEVRFTAKEGREPCANGVAGALRSG